jgi:hypothetical protein
MEFDQKKMYILFLKKLKICAECFGEDFGKVSGCVWFVATIVGPRAYFVSVFDA